METIPSENIKSYRVWLSPIETKCITIPDRVSVKIRKIFRDLPRPTTTLLYRPLQEMRSMAVIDLINIVDQRLADIAKLNPSLRVEEFYFEGETGLWCLITIQGNEGGTIEYEFIESEDSWKRTDVAAEYSEAALEQVEVVVPDQALADVLMRVRDYDAQGVSVADYSFLGLIPLPLTY